MQIMAKPATQKAGSDIFSGDAWIDVIARGRGAVAGSGQRRSVRARSPERVARPRGGTDGPRHSGHRPDPGPWR